MRRVRRHVIAVLFLAVAALIILPGLMVQTHSASAAPVLSKTSVRMKVGKKKKIKLQGLSRRKAKKVRWHTSDKKVVSLSTKKGSTVRVRGNRSGVAAVWAKYKGQVYVAVVKVGTGTRFTKKTRAILDKYGIVYSQQVGEVTPLKANPTGKKILIVCGHGSGDPGATSKWGQEQNYTREFAALVYNELTASGAFTVDMFNPAYDMYSLVKQKLSFTKVGNSTLFKKISGDGTYSAKTRNVLTSTGIIPDLASYSYILEIHFNAKSTGKDPDGDGNYTGIGYYVSKRKDNTQIEDGIINAVAEHGFKKWGGYKSGSLLNAKVCQEIGVNYALLETCFIDDGDDMAYYRDNKIDMARLVSNCIVMWFDTNR